MANMTNTNTSANELRSNLDRLHGCMEDDGISTKNLEHYCTVAYRMGVSPISTLRNYVKVNNVNITVQYLETRVWNAGTMDFIRSKVSNKTAPFLLVVALKNNGFAKKVKIYYVSGLVAVKETLYPRLKCLV